MKKSYFLFASLALAATMVGCSKDDDVTTSNIRTFGENEIGFYAGTSRATVNDLSSLEDYGFTVYSTVADDTDNFYIEDKSYLYDKDSGWGWDGDDESWPTETTEYPIAFYAYYPDISVDQGSSPLSLTKSIEIADSENQIDILSALKSTTSKPVGGKLSLNFEHILSRVNLDIVAGDDSQLSIQSVVFAGLYDTNTYDFMTQTWSDWSDTSDTRDASYDYLILGDEATTLAVGDTFKPTNPDLMLMPHTLVAWNKSSTTPLTNARIEIIFRATNAAETLDQVGFSDAEDYPAYTDEITPPDNVNSPLFVKIAYPLTVPDSGNVWADGVNYTYTVELGGHETNNGYFADNVYYDEDGTRTDIPIEYAIVGEEVTGGVICFDVTVSKWVDYDSDGDGEGDDIDLTE